MRSQEKGFTLIEQLIVITLIVTVLRFGALRMIRVYQENSFSHAEKDLIIVLRFLQMKSIEDGKIYELSIPDGQKKITVKRQVRGESELQPFKASWIQALGLGQSLTLSLERGNNLLFYPDGTTSKNPLLVSRESGEKMTLVLKNRIGSVAVKKSL